MSTKSTRSIKSTTQIKTYSPHAGVIFAESRSMRQSHDFDEVRGAEFAGATSLDQQGYLVGYLVGISKDPRARTEQDDFTKRPALNEALKSFESTMKAICDKRNWTYNPNDTSKKLIEICFNNGLIPQFWQQKMTSIRVLLESSVPTGRNKLSGHGQGSAPVTVPSYIVAYVLHMTAAAILFLSEAENELI